MHGWVALVGALAGLAVGPLLRRVARRRARALDVLDGYVLVAIGGLATLHVLPHAIAEAGGVALLAAAVGLWAPSLLERRMWRTRGVTLWLVIGGLMVHAALDGAALVGAGHGAHGHGHGHGGEALALAVIVHRLPMGLVVYLAAGAHGGVRAGVAAVGAMMGATVLGFAAGDAMLHAAPGWVMGIFEALVIGGVLHVVGHGHAVAATDDAAATLSGGVHLHAHAGHAHHHGHHDHEHDHPGPDHGHHDHGHHDHGHHDHGHHGHRPPHGHIDESAGAARASAIGAVLGALTMLLVDPPPGVASGDELSMGATLATLALEVAPFLLLAYVASGLLATAPGRIPPGGGALRQAITGVVYGLRAPVCACSAAAHHRVLRAGGVSAAAAAAALAALPALGLDAVLISIPLLGPTLAGARIAAAAALALIAGLALARAATPPPPPAPEPARRPGWRFGLNERVDHTLPWVVAGLVVAALMEPLTRAGVLGGIPAVAQVPLAVLLAVPFYVCAAGATPLAAVAMHKGLSAGAAVGFLLAGPVVGGVVLRAIAHRHGRRAAVAFGAVVVLGAMAAGWSIDALALAPAPDLHDRAAAVDVGWRWACVAGVGLLGGWSLWRQGARGLVEQIVHPVRG